MRYKVSVFTLIFSVFHSVDYGKLHGNQFQKQKSTQFLKQKDKKNVYTYLQLLNIMH